MIKAFTLLTVAAFTLGACANTLDTGVSSYSAAIAAESVITTDKVISTTGPTLEITSSDCRRGLGDNAPSSKVALDRLKTKAAQNGFNAIHSVTVVSSGGAALLANCWAEVKATGVAYNN